MEKTYTIDTRERAIDTEATEYVRRTLQNARNLLMLCKGEVPYDRMRGIHPGLFDMNLAQAESVITQEVVRVLAWEPDVRVSGVRILPETDGKDGRFIIEADVIVKGA